MWVCIFMGQYLFSDDFVSFATNLNSQSLESFDIMIGIYNGTLGNFVLMFFELE